MEVWHLWQSNTKQPVPNQLHKRHGGGARLICHQFAARPRSRSAHIRANAQGHAKFDNHQFHSAVANLNESMQWSAITKCLRVFISKFIVLSQCLLNMCDLNHSEMWLTLTCMLVVYLRQ